MAKARDAGHHRNTWVSMAIIGILCLLWRYCGCYGQHDSLTDPLVTMETVEILVVHWWRHRNVSQSSWPICNFWGYWNLFFSFSGKSKSKKIIILKWDSNFNAVFFFFYSSGLDQNVGCNYWLEVSRWSMYNVLILCARNLPLTVIILMRVRYAIRVLLSGSWNLDLCNEFCKWSE